MPYKLADPLQGAHGRKKRPIAARRVKPAIFVQMQGVRAWHRKRYVQAHIRVRRGCYRYLVWREAGAVREFYLGKVRESCPTVEPGPRRRRRPDRALPAHLACRVQKRGVL